MENAPIARLMVVLDTLIADLQQYNTPDQPLTRSRELSLAITKLEEALMWGEKASDLADMLRMEHGRT